MMRFVAEMMDLRAIFAIAIVLTVHLGANGSPELIFETHYVFEQPPPPYFPPKPEPLEVMVDITNQLGKLVSIK